MVFCNAKHWTCNVRGHIYICQTPSPHGTSKTSKIPWIWLAPSCSICTFDLEITWFTQGWKKFTWSCLCESPFDMGARFAFHLQEPKISSPSMCVTLAMQDNPKAYFKTMFVNCFESPDWVVIHKSNLLLLGPWLGQPPCLKWKYNVDCLTGQT